MKDNSLISLELHLEAHLIDAIKGFAIEIMEICATSSDASKIIKTSEVTENRFIEENKKKLKELFSPLITDLSKSPLHKFTPLQESCIKKICKKLPFISQEKFLQFCLSKKSKSLSPWLKKFSKKLRMIPVK